MIAPTANAAVKPSTSANGAWQPAGGDRVPRSATLRSSPGRDAERAADLLRRVDQPGGEARHRGGHARQSCDRLHEREPDAHGDQQEVGQQIVEVRASDRDLREVHEPGRERVDMPTTSTGLTPTRVTSCAAIPDVTIAVPATAR